MYITCIICCCVVTSYMFWLCMHFITCVYTYYLHDVIYMSTVLLAVILCNDKIFMISILGAWLSIAAAISLTYGILWLYMSPGLNLICSGTLKHHIPGHHLGYKNSCDVHTVRFYKVHNQLYFSLLAIYCKW